MQVFFLLAFGACCSLTVNWFATVTFGWVVGLRCFVFPVVSPRVDYWHFRKFVELWPKLDPDPWEGLVELLLWVCVNIVMFILTITFDLVYLTTLRRCRLRWTSSKSCHILVYSAFSNSDVVGFDWCYVAEGWVTSQELKIKQ